MAGIGGECRGGAAEGSSNGRHAIPDTFVRVALVERLRRDVQDGTYRVDARAVATRMLPVLFPQGLPS